MSEHRLQKQEQGDERAMGYVADHHDALFGELTDKQKETLEKFDDCWDELTDINEREIFVPRNLTLCATQFATQKSF